MTTPPPLPFCSNRYRQQPTPTADDAPLPTLPPHARLPINRCNLPALILGGLTFQHYPTTLEIDGVRALHRPLFRTLATLPSAAQRAARFSDYMTKNFRLDHPEEAGLEAGASETRHKADYLRLLRGWFFSADGREGAVFKGWVESRFGLLACSHDGPLEDPDSERYQRYLAARAQGLYNTNALEGQLDLLFTYCQYELHQRHPNHQHVTLYRGINRLCDHQPLSLPHHDRTILLLNSLNSFTANRDRAGEFGDTLLEGVIPLAKIVYFPDLLPKRMCGEEEFLVLGGMYEMHVGYW